MMDGSTYAEPIFYWSLGQEVFTHFILGYNLYLRYSVSLQMKRVNLSLSNEQ
ncbi:hypothetical protein [Oceanirhabdus seepicola]|uniref:Uncharacterized protein n=1 Tax=Oceanirhabdus seepicola TaxID=2828781 RepID=A0A9J6P5V0_9CLOT|nr:hypothetical protein [Oceanirhabdus seepicola]MCM1991497.1 hypothetical protein [Oceanirhabdus seepicola]